MYFQNTNVDALGHSSYRYLRHAQMTVIAFFTDA